MTARNNAPFDKLLADIFANGRGEAGLEVGVDPGLSQQEYVQIPRCLVKPWVDRVNKKSGDEKGGKGKQAASSDTSTPGSDAAGPFEFGTFGGGTVYIWKGRLFRTKAHAAAGKPEITIERSSPSYDDVRRFVLVNTTHIRDAELSVDQVKWVHATRFWSVVSGLVTSSKSSEYVVVDDPVGSLDAATEVADFVVGFSGNAWTAAAARATSWRKSNHATGGDIATGFPRRWLQKMTYWPSAPDKATRERSQRQVTSAFYVATHACSVHAVLALMADTDDCHWAEVNPSMGLIPEWDVRESTKIRMTPRTQVSGTAMVTDAVVCLKMMIKEGIAPLLDTFDAFTELAKQFAIVEKEGIKVAGYAGWFLDGHPAGYTRVDFNQKDVGAADLIGELGAVATKYYSTTSIGDSPALLNASSQLGSDQAVTKWSTLGRAKRQMTGRAVIQAYGRIKGASASSRVASLNSNKDKVRDAAVGEYNDMLTKAAKAFGVVDHVTIEAATVAANSAAADRQADALDALAAASAQAPAAA